jgi:maltoporin
MIRLSLLVFLALPLLASAQEAELESLRQELRELKQINALYVERLEAMERKLQALEQDEPGERPGTPDAVTHVAETTADAFGGEAGQSHDTGFDPRRFDYYGYARAGYGVDQDGTKQERFQAPGSGAAYRLGNETDTYMETGFSWFHEQADRPDPPLFGTHFMLAYSTLEKNTSIDLASDSGTVSLRQAYATARGLAPEQPDSTVWVGQRFYRRHDVLINDFWWLDMSGYGGGIEDYDAGFARVSLAWIGGTTDKFTGGNDYIGELETTDKNNFDLRLNDIDLGIGLGNVWLNYSKYRLAATELDLVDEDGWSGGFWLVSDLGERATNTAIVQYGTGVAANFNSFSPSLRTGIGGDFPEGTRVKDQSRLRLMDIVDFAWGERWSAQAVAIYQHDDLGLEQNSDLKWYSIGFRPVYSFSELYNLALEAGYDYTELDSGEEGGLLKLTAAGEITPEMGFFSRPALRFYLTYATWSDEFRGLIGGPTLRDDTEGLAVGVQFESWW